MVFGGGSSGGGGSVNLGSAYGTIVIGFDENGIDSALNRLDNTISGRLTSIGARFMNMGSQLSAVFSPITGFMGQGIAKFVEFDDILTEIEARTGSTAEEMEAVRETALQMGQDTAFSATDAADAMLELLASGYDLDQTFTALKPTLDAAAASQMALGQTADAVTDILAQFSLGAESAGMVADSLAAAAGASSATMGDLFASFTNIGPKAASFGLSVEDVSAVLAVMAENGIKGSRAGTQFSSMLDTLTSGTRPVTEALRELNVSLTDNAGNYRPLNEIIQDINRSMTETRTVQVRVNNLTGQQTDRLDAAQDAYARATRNIMLYNDGLTAGSLGEEERARRIQDATAIQANAANVIADVTGSQEEAQYITMQLTRTQEENFQAVRTLGGGYGDLALQALLNADGFETMLMSMEGQASAAEIAEKRMESMKGLLNTLSSTIETLSINLISKLEPGLRAVTGAVTGAFNALNQLIVSSETFGTVLAVVLAFLAVVGPAVFAFGYALTFVGTVIGLVSTAFGFLLSPIGLLIAAAAVLYLAYKKNFLGIQKIVDPVLDAFGNIADGIQKTYELLQSGEDIFTALRNGLGFFVDDMARSLGIPAEKARELQIIFQDSVRNIEAAFQAFMGIVGGMVAFISGAIDRIKQAFQIGGTEGMFQQIEVEARSALETLGSLIQEYGPIITENLATVANAFLSWIAPIVEPMLAELLALLSSIGQWIIDNAPTIAGYLLNWAIAFGTWIITEAYPWMMQKLGELSLGLLGWIAEQTPGILAQLLLWANAFIVWIHETAWPWMKIQFSLLMLNLIAWVGEQVGPLVAQLLLWANAFIAWINETAWPWMKIQFSLLMLNLIAWVGEQVPQLVAQLLLWANSFIAWINETAWPWMVVQFSLLMLNLIAWIGEQVPQIAAQLLLWANSFIAWIHETAWPSMLLQFSLLMLRVITWIGEQKTKLVDKVKEWATAFTEWAGDIWGDLEEKLNGFYSDIYNWIQGAKDWIFEDMKAMGTAIIDGLKQGINDGWDAFVSWLNGLWESLPGYLQRIAEIHSPSRVFAEIGKWIPEGVKVGIEGNMDAPLAAIRQMAELIAMPMPSPALAGAPVGAGMGSGTVNHNTFSVTVQLPNFQGTPEQAQAIGSAAADGFEERISQLLRNNQ